MAGTALDVTVEAIEYGYDLAYFRRMCAAGAVDCLQVDVSRGGGITEWLRVAAVAAAYQLEVSGHCAPHLLTGQPHRLIGDPTGRKPLTRVVGAIRGWLSDRGSTGHEGEDVTLGR